jgi:hypothetical protein
MIDENFRVQLIEVNTNPALCVPCPLLARILYTLLDSTLRVAIDPLFPCPDWSKKGCTMGEVMPDIHFELIFDEETDGDELKSLHKDDAKAQSKLIPSYSFS